MRVSVVVPTYLEAPNLPELIERVERTAHEAGLDLELIIVDDRSDDGTPEVVAGLSRPWVRLLVREARRDLSEAVLEGVRAAAGDTIVVMDADLSHPPERIPALLEALDDGAELAIGSRRVPGGSIDRDWAMHRRIASAVAALFARPLFGVRDPMSGFFAFRRALLDRCGGPDQLRPTGYKIGLEIGVRTGCRNIREVPIRFADRERGSSKLTRTQCLRYLEHLRRLYLFAIGRLWRRGMASAGPCAPAAARPRRARLALACLALALIVSGVFGRSVSFGFLGYDDRFHIHENSALHQPAPQRYTFFWRHAYGNLYVPIAYNLFGAEAALADRGTDVRPHDRFDPRVFHAVSVALHVAASVLVLLILSELFAGLLPALLGALFFALHPLQAESVGWISEQRGLLGTLLALGSAWVYLRSTTPHRSAWINAAGVLGALALFIGSMLAKPSTAPLPLALIAIDVLVRGRPLRFSVLRVGGWVLCAAGVLVATRLLQSVEVSREVAPLWQRPFIAGDSSAWYLARLAWPFGLSPDHGRTPSHVAASIWLYGAWAIPVGLGLGLVVMRRWRTFAGLLVMLCMLTPVLGLVSFHHQNISTVADRYASLAMLGPALALAAWLAARTVRRPLWIGGAACVVVVLGALSALQIGVWRSDKALWTHTLRVNPASALAHNNLGFTLHEAGDPAGALAHYEAALAIDPEHARVLTNTGLALRDLGRRQESVRTLRTAVERAPSDTRSLVALGTLLGEAGRRDEAISLFERALAVEPNNAEALGNLGLALAQGGEPARAEALYRAAIEADPWFGQAWHNLGVLLRATGREREAEQAWNRALRIDPGLAPTHQHLGDMLLAQGHTRRGAQHLRAATDLDPTNARAFNNLGLALVRLDDLAGATDAFENAVRADPTLRQARDNLEGARRLLEERRVVP